MLEDRDYMRHSSGGWHWSATMTLLVINVAVFLVVGTFIVSPAVLSNLQLSLEGLKQGYVWQLLTFQFLHAGWLHLIFNSVALFFFGRAVEHAIGKARFVQLYLAGGVAGGLLQVLLAAAVPAFFGGRVVGASAGVSALVAAFGVMNWNNRFTLFFYFFPINMRGRTLFLASLVLALVGILSPGDNVAHAAHLGGLLTGFAFIHYGIAAEPRSWRWNLFAGRDRKREMARAASLRKVQWPLSKANPPVDVPEEEFISKEVDPILDKISAHGIQSLTERERRILEAARSRMAKR